MTARKNGKPVSDVKPLGTALWLWMIFFTSALMFILGIFVGRGFAPIHFDINKLQKELVQLKKAAINKEEEKFKSNLDAMENETSFGFYNDLGETKKIVNKVKVSNKTRLTQKRNKSEKGQTNIIKKKWVAQKKKLVSGNKSDRPVHFTIQVASLKNQDEAGKMIVKLKKRGYSAYMVSWETPEKVVWHRVRIGSYPNMTEALDVAKRLTNDRYNVLVVSKQ